MASDEARQQYEFNSAQYARFGSDIAVEIRREVYGEDQGQQGWRTLDEQAQIAALTDRRPCHVLDIGCGSGGPSLALVAATGCTLRACPGASESTLRWRGPVLVRNGAGLACRNDRR